MWRRRADRIVALSVIDIVRLWGSFAPIFYARAPARNDKGKIVIDLVAFDMDGTVLNSQSLLADSALQTISALIDRGVPTASVSGRSIRRSLEPFASRPELAQALYMGGYNGAVVVGPDTGMGRTVLYEERLDVAVFRKLVEYGREQDLNLLYCMFEQGAAGIIEEYKHVEPVDHLDVLGGPGFTLDRDLYTRCLDGELGPPPKIMYMVDPARREAMLADIVALCGESVYVSWALPDRVEIMKKGVDKGVAVRALVASVSSRVERVLASGDADNDLPMLRVAGVGVLMGNANREVKETVAEWENVRVGPTFAEDGFAQIVREVVLVS